MADTELKARAHAFLIVVDDLEVAKAFFAELGMELEGEMPVEGRWVDRIVGLENVRAEIAMMRTPDGHGRVELTKFHSPAAIRTEPKDAPVNTLGIRRLMFAVETISRKSSRACAPMALSAWGEIAQYEDMSGSVSSAAQRASSSGLPSSSDEDLAAWAVPELASRRLNSVVMCQNRMNEEQI